MPVSMKEFMWQLQHFLLPYFGVRCWVQFQLDEKTKDFTT